jgi:hypothetical protein
MDEFEVTIHSFIVRIWLEETPEEAGQAVWRGYITHVPSEERHYLKGLDDITAYIAPYLGEMGVKLKIGWRVRQWLKRWKRSPTGANGSQRNSSGHSL